MVVDPGGRATLPGYGSVLAAEEIASIGLPKPELPWASKRKRYTVLGAAAMLSCCLLVLTSWATPALGDIAARARLPAMVERARREAVAPGAAAPADAAAAAPEPAASPAAAGGRRRRRRRRRLLRAAAGGSPRTA